jgi:uncharacterized membrane protein YhaH (DUF805 family)
MVPFFSVPLLAVWWWIHLAAVSKRLHDLNINGWWSPVIYFGTIVIGGIIIFVIFAKNGPQGQVAVNAMKLILGFIFLAVFGCVRGTDGPNRYGADVRSRKFYQLEPADINWRELLNAHSKLVTFVLPLLLLFASLLLRQTMTTCSNYCTPFWLVIFFSTSKVSLHLAWIFPVAMIFGARWYQTPDEKKPSLGERRRKTSFQRLSARITAHTARASVKEDLENRQANPVPAGEPSYYKGGGTMPGARGEDWG